MRYDIVSGSVFPDYELFDHTAKRRKLSELQGQDPMILVLGRGGYCPKDRRQAEGLVQLHRELEVATVNSLPSPRTVSRRRTNIAPASALIGLFFPIRGASSKKTSISPNTPILRTTR